MYIGDVTTSFRIGRWMLGGSRWSDSFQSSTCCRLRCWASNSSCDFARPRPARRGRGVRRGAWGIGRDGETTHFRRGVTHGWRRRRHLRTDRIRGARRAAHRTDHRRSETPHARPVFSPRRRERFSSRATPSAVRSWRPSKSRSASSPPSSAARFSSRCSSGARATATRG